MAKEIVKQKILNQYQGKSYGSDSEKKRNK